MPNQAVVRSQEETRRKILEAAEEVFADLGYQAATVRDICARAGANVAAVNYHFGDKMGLYRELLKNVVVQSEAVLSATSLNEIAPEEALYRFIRNMLLQMTEAERPAWYTRVMAHELVKPTDALAVVVEHIVRPKAGMLCGIVARIIGRPPLDPKTRMCAQSVIGQVVHYVHARPVIAILWPQLKMNRKTIETAAKHIAEFSVSGMKGVAQQRPHRAAHSRRKSK